MWANVFATPTPAATDIKILNMSGQRFKTLPPLSPTLVKLYCEENMLCKLPATLPPTLKVLICDSNQLRTLPGVLPPALKILSCSDNRLQVLPDALPPTLEELYCQVNRLAWLPKVLPNTLQVLNCANNMLLRLPPLPPGLASLDCDHNQLRVLPDLPESLVSLNVAHQHAEFNTNYPLLCTDAGFDFTVGAEEERDAEYGSYLYWGWGSVKPKVMYINECNSRRRTQARTLVFAKELADVYLRKALHPDRLQPLLDNPDADPHKTLWTP